MRKTWVFFLGAIIGMVLLSVIVLVIDDSNSDKGFTFFGEPGEYIEGKSFKVIQVFEHGGALAREKDPYAITIGVGQYVLFVSKDGQSYYDDQIIKVPSGKCVRQIGVYRYLTVSGSKKTVPVVDVFDSDIVFSDGEGRKSINGDEMSVGGILVSGACEAPKYADFLHLAHGLDGYFDYEQALKCAQAQNKPLFIDFTGHGCVNCREMEQTVWAEPRVLEMLRNDYVVVALYVDDKTTLPENEWYVSEYDGKKKKTLGKKNADFQIKKFDSNAQPNYILLDSRGGNDTDLKQHVLAPARGHNLDKDAFVNFLKQGLEEYKKR